MLSRIEERDAALHAAQKELEATNDTLEQQKASALAASKAKDQFLAMLSHELRTPLTPVLATVDSLESGSTAAEELPAIAAMIRRNVELEARLIDDLLDITRISRGKLSLSPEPLDLHSAVRSAIDLVRHELTAKQLELTLDLKAAEHFVNADSAKVQQVFWNLLRNAIKFTGSGGQIRVSSQNENATEIDVQVSDTGIGIPPEALTRIFDPFEQAEHSIQPHFGGLGLGLSISKGIAEAHGGRLDASSEGFGHGSTFRLTLAVIPAPSQPSAATPAPVRSAQKLRILLVEDHEDSRNALQRLLTRCGHSVVTASDFRTGVETARSASFDLLISDIGLPDGNGADLMRELQRFRKIKGIALSGLGMESDMQNSRSAGFSQHLIKPVSFEELKEAIDRIQVEPS